MGNLSSSNRSNPFELLKQQGELITNLFELICSKFSNLFILCTCLLISQFLIHSFEYSI